MRREKNIKSQKSPLSQTVGNAILNYLQNARPNNCHCREIRVSLHSTTATHLLHVGTALTSLAQHTDSESNVLTLSVGINISKNQILTGLKSLIGCVKVYGWLVEGHENDGSCPGKGWYNTAALLDKTIVQQMKEGIPKWVDNGVLGKIGKHTIGGNEEIPIMVQALQNDCEAKFILDLSCSRKISQCQRKAFEECCSL